MPGKFEGEPGYVAHYWDLGLSGGVDEDYSDADGTPVYAFHLKPHELSVWPELKRDSDAHGPVLRLWEDEQGFVHHNFGQRGE